MGEEKKGFFKRLVSGLTKTRDSIVSSMDSIFNGFSKIDEEFYEELEEVLIMGDLGVQATYAVLDDLRAKVKEQRIKEPMECKQLLIDSIKEQMRVGETAYEFEDRTSVVLVIGVNGVGKTTTIGKLAGKLRANNKKVVLAAADTFRAAAGEQLVEWARRADAELIGGQHNGYIYEIKIKLSYMMRLPQRRRVTLTYFSVIRQEGFTIRKILWKN